jgi:hypothetical protein
MEDDSWHVWKLIDDSKVWFLGRSRRPHQLS